MGQDGQDPLRRGGARGPQPRRPLRRQLLRQAPGDGTGARRQDVPAPAAERVGGRADPRRRHPPRMGRVGQEGHCGKPGGGVRRRGPRPRALGRRRGLRRVRQQPHDLRERQPQEEEVVVLQLPESAPGRVRAQNHVPRRGPRSRGRRARGRGAPARRGDPGGAPGRGRRRGRGAVPSRRGRGGGRSRRSDASGAATRTSRRPGS